VPLTLAAKSQHHQSRIVFRRICPKIGEVEIQCHKDSHFLLANVKNLIIIVTAHTLIVDGSGIMTMTAQQLYKIRGQILVDFESHQAILP